MSKLTKIVAGIGLASALGLCYWFSPERCTGEKTGERAKSEVYVEDLFLPVEKTYFSVALDNIWAWPTNSEEMLGKPDGRSAVFKYSQQHLVSRVGIEFEKPVRELEVIVRGKSKSVLEVLVAKKRMQLGSEYHSCGFVQLSQSDNFSRHVFKSPFPSRYFTIENLGKGVFEVDAVVGRK